MPPLKAKPAVNGRQYIRRTVAAIQSLIHSRAEVNSPKAMPRFSIRFLLPLVAAFTLPGCLIDTETAIRSDPKVDPRLAGVWQITDKLPHEVRGDRDEDDIGVNGYIIFSPLENPNGEVDESTLKGIAIDRFERDSKSEFPEMLVSTRKHNGHNLMLVRLPDYEKEEAKEGETTFKNWVLDYEFNEAGELFLRFWHVDNFAEMQEVHPMKFASSQQPFAPITLMGDENALLDFYTDPKIRALLTSMGKYRRLTPGEASNRKQPSAGPPATRAESR